MTSKEFIINGEKIVLTENDMRMISNSYRVELIAEYISENHPEVKGELLQEVSSMAFDKEMNSDLCEKEAIEETLKSKEVKKKIAEIKRLEVDCENGHIMELRAAFGAGTTVINVQTGSVYNL